MNETHTQPSDDARAVLLKLAGRLSSVRPTHAMQDSMRLAMVLTWTSELHGYMSDAAEDLEREVLRYAPAVDRDTTRGEYALILRKAAGGEGQ
ncbi:hypothetical protein ACIRQP_03520 [Streptomyces sp. NPDC102274]|uniref:hypothetical protein n=1 Tax=Streptomyces sp. NPDC102274 TaxID=3366151 RepID=UPI00380FFB3F